MMTPHIHKQVNSKFYMTIYAAYFAAGNHKRLCIVTFYHLPFPCETHTLFNLIYVSSILLQLRTWQDINHKWSFWLIQYYSQDFLYSIRWFSLCELCTWQNTRTPKIWCILCNVISNVSCNSLLNINKVWNIIDKYMKSYLQNSLDRVQ